jgi:hypothetical protein
VLAKKNMSGYQKRMYFGSIFGYPELNCHTVNKLEVDFEERQEFNFIMDFLKTRKKNAQLEIPDITLIQTLNMERAKISYNKHKDRLDKDLENRKRERNRRLQQEKIDKQKKYDIYKKKTRRYKSLSSLIKKYSPEKEKTDLDIFSDKNDKNNDANVLLNRLTTLQKDILSIDRYLLENTSKTVKNISKFVDVGSKLMVKKKIKDQKEHKTHSKKVKKFIGLHSGLIQSARENI